MMKKDTLLEIIFGTIGGLILAVGMCMCLIPSWNLFNPGIIIAIIGFILLLCIIPIYKKSHPKKEHTPIRIGLTVAIIVAVIGALILGVGMCKVMVGEIDQTDIITGIIIGIVGLLICILDFPIYFYIKNNKTR